MEIKGLSDARIIDFLSKSPVKNFATILDTLRYLDLKWIQTDLEYELFNWALGDNNEEKVEIRVPNVGGLEANALFQLTKLMEQFHFVRRRAKAIPSPLDGPEGPELITWYEVTSTGKKLRHILTQIETAKQNLK